MKVVNVVFRVKPGCAEEFLEIQREMAAAFEQVDGTYEFVVSQSDVDPDELRLFELYRDQAAFDEHLRVAETLPGRDRMGALVDVYVSLAAAAMASSSQYMDGGNRKVPSRQPPAPHHLLRPELMMVPSG